MITTVLTTYNRIDTLPRALKSVLGQTYRDIEVLVIDDGSTDNTERVVREIDDSRVRYIKLSENSGASAARNRGIQEAKGDFVLVWDSDDELYPNALEKVLFVFERHPEYAVVSAPARVLVDGKEMKFLKFPEGNVTLEDVLVKRVPSNEKVRVARADVMKRVLYKARNIDFLVNVELVEQGKWFHLTGPLADVHNNPEKGSLTSQRKKRSAKNSIERAPFLAAFADKYKDVFMQLSKTRYADHCIGAAVGFLLAHDMKKARHYAWEAVRNRPGVISYWVMWKLSWIPGGETLLRMFY